MIRKEIEFKYRSEVKMHEFVTFTTLLPNFVYCRYVTGEDKFYSKSEYDGTFYRIRTSEGQKELTFKKKTDKNNNYIREEYNIDLATKMDLQIVEDYLNCVGYSYNNKLLKVSVIIELEDYYLSWYACKTDQSEKYFIEIELKNSNKKITDKQAIKKLEKMEKLLAPIGVSKGKRVDASLFEIYRR